MNRRLIQYIDGFGRNGYLSETVDNKGSENRYMKSIPKNILDDIHNVIKEKSLFCEKKVVVAYSGGKDSWFLCLALKLLGYEVKPIIIDIGYNVDWSNALNNTELIGLEAIVIDSKYINENIPEINEQLNDNFKKIEMISNNKCSLTTICTPCYNSKILILKKWAELNGIRTIAIGHHATDAISSMLKSYYMYVDRWKYQHEQFDYNNLKRVIIGQSGIYSLNKDMFVKTPCNDDLLKQIRNQNVGTDEPILQYLGDTGVYICRPLFNVFEKDIIDFYENEKILFDKSECFKTNFRYGKYMTPRELIQYNLLKDTPISLFEYLLELVKESMDTYGFLKYNVRNNRTQILGSHYKDNIIKM